MPPQAAGPNPLPLLEYRDRSQDRLRTNPRLLRALSGVLALSAAATAALHLWYRLPPVYNCGVAIILAVGFTLRARATQRLVPFRSLWTLGIAIFGLWAFAILSNQFHGRPPPSSRYLIIWWAVSCAVSIAGLVLDTRRVGDAQ
jgi:hypothetical protein